MMIDEINAQIDAELNEHGIEITDLTRYWGRLGLLKGWEEDPEPSDHDEAIEKTLWMTVLKADIVCRKHLLRMAGVPESELEAPDEEPS